MLRLVLMLVLLAWSGGLTDIQAAAPLRDAAFCGKVSASPCTGGLIPYAEAELCATAPVVLCEDFNRPDFFFWDGTTNHAFDSWWKNPAITSNASDTSFGCGRADGGFSTSAAGWSIPLASTIVAKPSGAMPSGSDPDRIYRINWTTGSSAGPGQTQGFLIATANAATYCNGNALSKDNFIRMMIYLSADYVFPGTFPKPSLTASTYNECLDMKLFGFYPFAGFSDPTSAAYDGSFFTNCKTPVRSENQTSPPSGLPPSNFIRFGDAINIRYGSGGACSTAYATFPAWVNTGSSAPCIEYPQYTYNTLNLNTDTNDQPVACTFSQARPYYCTAGKMFRMSRARWYSMELHYKLSSTAGAHDGVIEMFIDGVRVYAADDLPTCSTGVGDCRGFGYIQILNYHNRNNCPPCNDQTPFAGQAYYDNLVISQAYIGPPGGAVASTPRASGVGGKIRGAGKFRLNQP